MITLKRNSRFVRWCWSMQDDSIPPSQSSICNLFWRGFVWAPISWGIVSLIFLAVFLSLCFIFFTSIIGIFSLAGVTILSLLLVSYMKEKDEVPASIVILGERMKNIKNKLCPIVKLEND